MANALKEMSYDEFLRFVETPESAALGLNTGAALGLCRGGTVKTRAPLAWLGVFWLSLIGIGVTFFFWDLRFIIAWVFLLWLSARRSKRCAIAAVWREIKGKGTLPKEERERMYAFLVSGDWLYLPAPDPVTPAR